MARNCVLIDDGRKCGRRRARWVWRSGASGRVPPGAAHPWPRGMSGTDGCDEDADRCWRSAR